MRWSQPIVSRGALERPFFIATAEFLAFTFEMNLSIQTRCIQLALGILRIYHDGGLVFDAISPI